MKNIERRELFQKVQQFHHIVHAKATQRANRAIERHRDLLCNALRSLPKCEQAQYTTLYRMSTGRRSSRRHSSSRNGQYPSNRSLLGKTKSLMVGLDYVCDEENPVTDVHVPGIYQVDFRGRVVEPEHFYGLFVGNMKAANDQAVLSESNIQAVLSLGEDNSPHKFTSVKGGYFKVELPDNERAKLAPYYEKIYRFIRHNIARGNVLIHCFSGESRSCAVAIYFLVRCFRVSFNVASDLVLSSRGCGVRLRSSLAEELNRTARSILESGHSTTFDRES